MFKSFKFSILALALLIVSSAASTANAKHILVFGDSLSAAYGMDAEQGWVYLLGERLLSSRGSEFRVSNASISGETTRGGLARINVTMEEFQPDIVLLELGANDGLQGYPIDLIRSNLDAMIDQIQANGAQVALLGISLPPSYGPRYVDQFRNLFPDIAEQRHIPFIDLYQEKYYLEPGYIQRDGLHPTEKTQPIIRDAMMDFLIDNNLL